MQKLSTKKYFSEMTNEQLIAQLHFLIKQFPNIKEYYKFNLSSENQKEIIDKYKESIKREFFPKRGFGEGSTSVANVFIKKFLKVSSSPEQIIDLMLYYVEQRVKFTIAYGDIDEKFYSNLETTYENAMNLIKKNNLNDEFYSRSKKIHSDTEWMGWGFGDRIGELFWMCYKKY